MQSNRELLFIHFLILFGNFMALPIALSFIPWLVIYSFRNRIAIFKGFYPYLIVFLVSCCFLTFGNYDKLSMIRALLGLIFTVIFFLAGIPGIFFYLFRNKVEFFKTLTPYLITLLLATLVVTYLAVFTVPWLGLPGVLPR